MLRVRDATLRLGDDIELEPIEVIEPLACGSMVEWAGRADLHVRRVGATFESRACAIGAFAPACARAYGNATPLAPISAGPIWDPSLIKIDPFKVLADVRIGS